MKKCMLWLCAILFVATLGGCTTTQLETLQSFLDSINEAGKTYNEYRSTKRQNKYEHYNYNR